MLKLGIHSESQLPGGSLTTWLGGRKYIAADLYPAALERNETVAEALLRLLVLANGTRKFTSRARFPEFDRRAAAEIAKVGERQPITIHEVAVSDGRTAVEFYQCLDAAGIEVDYFASDLVPFVFVYPSMGSGSRIVVDPEQQLLQVVAPPFVFNVPRKESVRFYPLNHLVLKVLGLSLVRRLRRELSRRGLEAAHRVDLVSRECLELARSEARFHYGRHDLFFPLDRPVDVIRAMNILNPSYFSSDDLNRILSAFCQSLNPGGLLVTGSNWEAGSEVEGGVYRSTSTGFEVVFETGGGSRVRDLITAME